MPERKTALVLSAGGMFGAYQAGAYQTVSEIVQPDLVVGASAGALNGWLIASGCSPEELIGRWRDPNAGEALRFVPNAGWRNGWFDPAALRRQVEVLHREHTPQIPFGLVMVQVAGFGTRLIQSPDVLPGHLQATCSIPLFLPAVKIDGRRYVDGGVFERLPIQAAMEMGATRIIAVDALANFDLGWMRPVIGMVRLFRRKRRLPSDFELTIVSPSEPLGTVKDAVFWKAENVERWIDLGIRDAARALKRELNPVA